jgi:hypothetical protein
MLPYVQLLGAVTLFFDGYVVCRLLSAGRQQAEAKHRDKACIKH